MAKDPPVQTTLRSAVIMVVTTMYSVVAADGKLYGPVDVSTLKDWCVEGRVRPETNVVDGISGRTYLALELQDLYGSFEFSGSKPPPIPNGPQALVSHSPTMAYGAPAPYQTYSLSAVKARPVKSKLLAILLAFFFGVFGAHRFYLGHTSKGAASLMLAVFGFICLASVVAIPMFILIFIALGVWSYVDIALIATGALGDARGCMLGP